MRILCFTVRLWDSSQNRESHGKTVRHVRFAFFFSNTTVFTILLWYWYNHWNIKYASHLPNWSKNIGNDRESFCFPDKDLPYSQCQKTIKLCFWYYKYLFVLFVFAKNKCYYTSVYASIGKLSVHVCERNVLYHKILINSRSLVNQSWINANQN